MNARSAALVGVMLLAGCAAVPPPKVDSVRFMRLSAPATVAPLPDSRPAEVRATRSGQDGYLAFHYLGDTATEPPLDRLIAARVSALAPPVPVSIKRLEVGFWRGRGGAGGGSMPYVYAPGPVGAVIVGNLVGQGLVALAKGGAGADQKAYASAVIEVEIGGKTLWAGENVALGPFGSPEEAVERALETTLDRMAEQVRQEIAAMGGAH